MNKKQIIKKCKFSQKKMIKKTNKSIIKGWLFVINYYLIIHNFHWKPTTKNIKVPDFYTTTMSAASSKDQLQITPPHWNCKCMTKANLKDSKSILIIVPMDYMHSNRKPSSAQQPTSLSTKQKNKSKTTYNLGTSPGKIYKESPSGMPGLLRVTLNKSGSSIKEEINCTTSASIVVLLWCRPMKICLLWFITVHYRCGAARVSKWEYTE